jgi:hypothetical protein
MNKAIEMFPDRSEPYFHLGKYFNDKSRCDLGYKYFKLAQEQDFDSAMSKYILFVERNCYGKHINDELSVSCYWTDKGEEGIIEKIIPLVMSRNPFSFVPIGNNLNFEYKFLVSKINHYRKLDIDVSYFHNRPSIDLKPVMVLLNGGRFKGYNLILNKSGSGSSVPQWYDKREFNKIIEYVIDETTKFTTFYYKIYHLMFDGTLKNNVLNHNRRLDDFV